MGSRVRCDSFRAIVRKLLKSLKSRFILVWPAFWDNVNACLRCGLNYFNTSVRKIKPIKGLWNSFGFHIDITKTVFYTISEKKDWTEPAWSCKPMRAESQSLYRTVVACPQFMYPIDTFLEITQTFVDEVSTQSGLVGLDLRHISERPQFRAPENEESLLPIWYSLMIAAALP